MLRVRMFFSSGAASLPHITNSLLSIVLCSKVVHMVVVLTPTCVDTPHIGTGWWPSTWSPR